MDKKYDFRITKLQIESTNLCNLRCSICWHTFGNISHFGELLFTNFKKIIDQFDYLENICLQGAGEPFLARDIFLMIQYARKKQFRVWLTSNATLLTEGTCKKIIRSDLSLLRISIDARKPEIYSKIKIGSDINVVIKNIKNLNRLKKEFKSDIPKLVINTVALKSSIGDLLNLVELAKEFEINEISLIPLVVLDKGLATKEESMASNKELFFKNLSKAKKLAELYNIEINSSIAVDRHPESNDLPQKEIPPCINSCYIDYQGEVSPCPCCSTIYSCGNIIKHSFIDIWNNKKYMNFRSYILDNKPTCNKCTIDIGGLKVLN